MTVVGIGAQTDIADNEEIGEGFLQVRNGSNHWVLVTSRRGANRILCMGEWRLKTVNTNLPRLPETSLVC